jgi:Acyl-CoA synthetases (AMP-forming)/AMP-acid ligases II
MKLIELLKERAPEQPAVVQNGAALSVGGLMRDAVQLAGGLQRAGMKPGETAVLAALPDAGFVCIVYAALLLNIRLAVIDPEMGRDNYRAKLRQLSPKWAFVDYRLLLLQEHPLLRWLYFLRSKKGIYFPINKGMSIIATGPWMPILQKHSSYRSLFKNAPPLIRPENSAQSEASEFLVTYTSGTTSVPKGVVHSVGAITASILQIAELIKGGHNRRLATHLPYFAIIGLNAGVEAYLWDYRLSAEEQWAFVEQNDITTLFAPPCDYLPMIERAEKNAQKLPDCLQHLFFGSAPVHRSFLERLIAVLPPHVRMTCLYGMTENLVVASVDGREKAQLPTQGGDILGKPVPNVDIRLAPDGEILVRSPQMYSRYLHLESRDEWHQTGDLGYIDAEGRIVLTGRKKDMVIRRNFNLYPGLYEPTVNRIPGVVECAFVGVFDETKHDETVVLFVEANKPLVEAAFRRQLEFGTFSIDKEALPDAIFFEKLPRAGRQSKVDKNALRERAAALLRGQLPHA